MTKLLRVFICLFVFVGHGQKVTKRAVVSPTVTLVNIDAQYCYAVDVATVEGDTITIVGEIDGEYHREITLNTKEEGRTLHIGTGFRPSFALPNDKLGAHKVVSIMLRVQLPRNKEIQLLGYSSDVKIKGSYSGVQVGLNDGSCRLDQVEGNVNVRSQSGDIFVLSKSADIKANSKYGSVSNNGIPPGHHTFELQTVTGNIQLRKTE